MAKDKDKGKGNGGKDDKPWRKGKEPTPVPRICYVVNEHDSADEKNRKMKEAYRRQN